MVWCGVLIRGKRVVMEGEDCGMSEEAMRQRKCGYTHREIKRGNLISEAESPSGMSRWCVELMI